MGTRRLVRVLWGGALCLLIAPGSVRAQPAPGEARPWVLRAAGNLVAPDDGGFDATRPNGKRVRTELAPGIGVRLELERRLGRRAGVTMGLMAGSRHDLELVQDFPDGTGFRSSDRTPFRAFYLGGVLHVTPKRRADLHLQALLLRSSYADVTLAGAGPPFDRTAPLEADVEARFGGGLLAGLDWAPAGGRFGIHASLGVLVVRLAGPFVSAPEGGDEAADLDLRFNPVVASAGISVRF